MKLLQPLRRLVERPWFQVSLGIILIASGFEEALDALEEADAIGLGSHHGVMLLGLMHVIKVLPDVAEAVTMVAIEESADPR